MKTLLRLLISLLFFTATHPSAIAQTKNEAEQLLASPIFKDGEAQKVAAFSNPKEWIKEQLWVETTFDSDNDGKPDRMHVFVTRPLQTESQQLKLPVVYTSSPYYGLKLFTYLEIGTKKTYWDVKHEIGAQPKPRKHPNHGTRKKRPFIAAFMDTTWVPRGYIMVYSSSPGTGLSDGVPTVGGENESLAPKAVIDWLCGRAKGYKTRTGNEEVKADWSTGKVGMTGTSFDGTLCIAAATTGVEGLEAIIPVAPVSSFYHYYRSNGLVRSPEGYLGEDMDVLYDFISTGDKSKRKYSNANIRDKILLPGEDRLTGDYNDFWQGRDYVSKIKNMHAAMIMAHGLNDWNVMPEQSYRFYKAAKENGLPVQLFYHPYGHGGNPPMEMMNRWFTRYLFGIQNGVENDSPVCMFREHADVPTYYKTFPNADATDVKLYLEAGKDGIGYLSLNKPNNQPTETLVDNSNIHYKKMLDSTNRTHRLLYVSPALENEIHLSGTFNISIKLASNKPAGNLSAYLITLPIKEGKGVQIYDNLITRGWADPQNYKSVRKGEALVPGEFYQVSFELMPDDQVIPKGKQIALMIFSSDKEFTLLPKPGTQLTIDPNLTSITLPIVGGSNELMKAFGIKVN